MENVKKSMEVLSKIANHRAVINDFARSKYIERFGYMKKEIGTYHAYNSYDVISETKLEVKYVYGGGDMEIRDSFIVEIE